MPTPLPDQVQAASDRYDAACKAFDALLFELIPHDHPLRVEVVASGKALEDILFEQPDAECGEDESECFT